jgi:glycosyltransferase A (GT-A) superfamily protein (DUF2064 family)
MNMNSLANGASNDGVILLVAKVPTPSKCKTRLIPLLGEVGSATLAKAMLADVLLTLTHCVGTKRTYAGEMRGVFE